MNTLTQLPFHESINGPTGTSASETEVERPSSPTKKLDGKSSPNVGRPRSGSSELKRKLNYEKNENTSSTFQFLL